jgi:hypothetical protein
MADAPDTDTYSVDRVLAQDGGRRRQLRLGLVRAGARRFFEARVYFENPQGQMSPTRKGVVLTQSNFLALLRTLETHAEDVRQWLGLTYAPEDVREGVARVANHRAERALPGELTWQFVNAGRGGPPFNLDDEGGRVTVNFNAQHVWVTKRVQPLEATAQRAIAELVAAEEMARRLARASGESDEFEGVLELLEIHRSVILDSVRGR